MKVIEWWTDQKRPQGDLRRDWRYLEVQYVRQFLVVIHWIDLLRGNGMKSWFQSDGWLELGSFSRITYEIRNYRVDFKLLLQKYKNYRKLYIWNVLGTLEKRLCSNCPEKYAVVSLIATSEMRNACSQNLEEKDCVAERIVAHFYRCSGRKNGKK